MSESTMRGKLVRALRGLDAVAVENPACPGTPDVNYVGGWIECKWLRHWPQQAETPVRLPHPVTPQQRIWLLRRTARGGLCWVMLQCKNEWLLFKGDVAADNLGSVTLERLREIAVWRSTSGLAPKRLEQFLREA